MMKSLIAALALFPAMASAQSYQGSVVDLQYQHYDDGNGFKINTIEGNLDAVWQFGRIGVQAGLSLGKEVNNPSDFDLEHYQAAALHLTTDVSDSLRFGAMIAADNNYDSIYLYAAEALYQSGPLRVEGRLGDSFSNSDPFSMFEVKGSYAITGPVSVRFGTYYSDYGPFGYYRTMSLGAGFKTASGTEFYADLSRHENDFGGSSPRANGSLFDIGVRFNLGAGGADKAFSFQPLN